MPEADSSLPLKVGFIGLGRMGSRMAANIARAGFPLMIYNRTATKAKELAREVGATSAASPSALASGCDVVVTMLSDDSALEAVYGGPDGILNGLRPGSIGIDMSTVAPVTTRRLGERVRALGSTLVDAPVSGSVALAASGKLLIMVGGDDADIIRVQPILEAMGSRVIRVGGLGAAAAMKLAVNTVIYGLNQALSEGLVLAERAGVERKLAYEVLASSAVGAPFVHYRRDDFERPGEIPAAMPLPLAEKDLVLALDLANQVGAPMPQALHNREQIHVAAEAGFAEMDISAIAEYLRRQPPVAQKKN
jgi:3-hydroxyisobutyrate dehydrogenase/2-hydroxy-3-oxopropionate reductase